MLRTSVVPTMLKAGVGPNVIPSEAEATIDIRALPDEDIAKFYRGDAKGDRRSGGEDRAAARRRARLSPASRLDTEMYRDTGAGEPARCIPASTVLPTMSTGASDKAQLRAKGIQSYGIGPYASEADTAQLRGARRRRAVDLNRRFTTSSNSPGMR